MNYPLNDNVERQKNEFLPFHCNNGYANALQCTLYVRCLSYLYCKMDYPRYLSYSIIQVSFLLYCPDDFHSFVATRLLYHAPAYRCYFSDVVNTAGVDIAILLERTVSEKAK